MYPLEAAKPQDMGRPCHTKSDTKTPHWGTIPAVFRDSAEAASCAMNKSMANG